MMVAAGAADDPVVAVVAEDHVVAVGLPRHHFADRRAVRRRIRRSRTRPDLRRDLVEEVVLEVIGERVALPDLQIRTVTSNRMVRRGSYSS
jgi:hypothetical protein